MRNPQARRARHRRRLALWLAAIGAVLSQDASAAGWGGSLGVASDYVFRGVTQSDGKPSAQGDVHYHAAAGWFAGLWAASVERSSSRGTTAELNAYLGYSLPLADAWNATVSAVHYDYPWNKPHQRYSYDEVVGTVAYADRLFLTAAASPDTSVGTTYGVSERRAAYSYDLAFHAPLFQALSANGGIGYYDLHRLVNAGYIYWSIGLGYDLGPLQLQLSYIGTNGTAKALFYDDAAHNRWAATALWHF